MDKRPKSSNEDAGRAPGDGLSAGQRTRIVVVEDSEDLREMLALLLEQEGYAVEACRDAEEGFAAVRRERAAVVLTDLMLGATSGLDLITRIRSDLTPPVPAIVACSGFTSFEREALQRGAAAFIPKPFDADSVTKSVRAIVARRELEESERSAARAHSRSMRAEAIEAARLALERLAPRSGDLWQRGQWTAEFLPRYFGFGELFVAIIQGESLEVGATSNVQTWRRGLSLELPICRDIIETRSALLVSDLDSLGAVVRRPDGGELRFFAGVPISSGSTAVGALCFVDGAPRPLVAEEFSILEAFAQRYTALLSDREFDIAPIWTPAALLTRETLNVLLAAELSRVEKAGLSLELVVFGGRAPSTQPSPRTAIAELGEGRFAALFTRESEVECRRAALDLLVDAARGETFSGGGLVSIEGGPETLCNARGVVHAAEGLLERSSRSGRIERVVVRPEPLVLPEFQSG